MQLVVNAPVATGFPGCEERGSATTYLCTEIIGNLSSAILVTSAMNNVVAYKQISGIDAIFRYLPCEMSLTRARSFLSAHAPHFAGGAHAEIDTLFDEVQRGTVWTKRCEFFDGSSEKQDWGDLYDLSLHWRHVCALGFGALRDLGRSLRESCPAEVSPAMGGLLQMLRDVRDGSCPYIGSDGEFILPSWLNRRSDERQIVKMAARVSCGNEVQEGIVRDISRHGVGLDGVFGLRRGRRVAVEIENGCRFEGVVIWAAGGRAGVGEQRS